MDAFWNKVSKTDSCWVWTGAMSGPGYKERRGCGSLRMNGKGVKAHRLSWEMANGPIPDGLCVLHKCDNPPCVNPAHLFLGTQADNARDRQQKGRSSGGRNGGGPPGERNGYAKLTDKDVRAIRAAPDGERHKDIAERFGVTRSVVSGIRRGSTWKHLL